MGAVAYAADTVWIPVRGPAPETGLGLVFEADTGVVSAFRALERNRLALGLAGSWRLSDGAAVRASYAGQALWMPDGSRVVGSGDVRLGTHARLIDRRAEIWLESEIKLPNAPDESGLGTDETDWLGRCWVRWNGPLRIDAGVGAAILGSPNAFAAQDDALLTDVRVTLPTGDAETWLAFGGRAWSPENPPDLALRFGASRHKAGLVVGAEAIVGLTPAAPDVGGRLWLAVVPSGA